MSEAETKAETHRPQFKGSRKIKNKLQKEK